MMNKQIKSKTNKNIFTVVQQIINNNNHQKLNRDGNVSYKTRQDRAMHIMLGFRELRNLGYKIENPYNLKEKHIEVLAKYWEKKKLSASTIQTRLSAFRNFAEWIGKGGMIKKSEFYVEDKQSVTRELAAQYDKSWAGNGVNASEKIDSISMIDEFVGIQLKIIKAFGLRRREGVMLRPIIADQGAILAVTMGTKGGRPRNVLIDTEYKRQVLDEAKRFVSSRTSKVNGHLGNPNLNLQQNLNHYSYIVSKMGLTKAILRVTGHGLRAEYSINTLIENGITPSVCGGTGRLNDIRKTKKIHYKLVEELGHSDIRKIAAYAGAMVFRKR